MTPRHELPSRAAQGGSRARWRAAATGWLHEVAVLDGRTLSGHGVLRGAPPLAKERPLSIVLTPAKRFWRGRARLPTMIDLRTDGDVAMFRFAAHLEDPDGPALRRGLWRVTLNVRPARGSARRVALSGELAPDAGGPVRMNPRSPVTGVRYRPGTSDDAITLNVSKPPDHAEVDAVIVVERVITVAGRLFGNHDAAPSRLRLESSDADSVRRVPVKVQNGGFSAEIPTDASMVIANGVTWTVAMECDGGPEIRVARILTDVSERNDVFRYPLVVFENGHTVRPAFGASGAFVLRGRIPDPDLTTSDGADDP